MKVVSGAPVTKNFTPSQRQEPSITSMADIAANMIRCKAIEGKEKKEKKKKKDRQLIQTSQIKANRFLPG